MSTQFLNTQLWVLPYLLIYAIGIRLSYEYRHRHPPVFKLSLVAFVILLVNLLLQSWWIWWLGSSLERGKVNSEINTIAKYLGIYIVLSGVVGWVLLLAAFFGWREDQDSGELVSEEELSL
jgi:hypothetical protein